MVFRNAPVPRKTSGNDNDNNNMGNLVCTVLQWSVHC